VRLAEVGLFKMYHYPFFEGTGLALAEHEVFGKKVVVGGLVLAIKES